MARPRKIRYQKLRNFVLGALVFIMLGMIIGGLAQAIIVFMLTGIISGTNIVVPVWGMVVLYMSIAAFVGLTYHIDRELENHYLQKLNAQRRLPRRRYSHS